MDAGLKLLVLGPFQVEQNGRLLTRFESDKARALLAYLALAKGPHSRESLSALFWPDLDAKAARHNLSQVIFSLRQLLAEPAGQPLFLADRYGVSLDPAFPLYIDARQFNDWLDDCRRHPHEQPELCADCAAWRQQAVALYHGNLLEGLAVQARSEFDNWLTVQQERFHRQALDALQALARYHEWRGEYEAAREYAQRQVALEPWREEAHRQLMLILTRTGQPNAALAQYRECCRILAEELAVEPDPETTILYERIKAAPPARLHKLPLQPTPFIGREEELAEIQRLLANPDCRLLTIVGVGGIGKSRLAIQAAELAANDRIRMFLHGVVFIPLAGVNSADFLVPAIARELPLSLRGREAPEQQLLNYLQDKELLLLLDNYEHLMPGTTLLASILQEVRDVKLLITSRRQLNLREEWLFEVKGLRYPAGGLVDRTPETLRSFDAVRLFEAGARRVQPGFSLAETSQEVLQLCRLVDGMPLALELAASQLNAVPCKNIVKELERNLSILATTQTNIPARHRSVRAAFEWSWVSLTPGEREVVRQLSLFRGGFTLEAAISVSGAPQATLASLVGKSLLRLSASGRYEIHDLLRQFASEKLLEPSERVAAYDRHLAYFLALAAEAESHLEGLDQLLWLDQLKIEYDNLIAALQWAWEHEKAELAARLSGALGGFWGIRGYLGEGKRWLAAALSQRQQLSAATLAQVLYVSGWLAFEQGDYAQAKRFFEESLALWREVGDKAKTARLLNRLGHVAQQQGDFARTIPLYEESLALYQELGDKSGIALSLNRLGHLAQLEGDDRGAVPFLEESLALRRELDDKRGMASSLNALAEVARYQGNYHYAASLYEESLDLCRQLGDKRCVAGVCHNLAYVALYQIDFGRAIALFRESLTLFQELENRGGVALCLAGLAAVLGAQGQPERAAQLLGASEVLLEVSSTSLSPADQQAWMQNLTLVRGQLEDAVFATAYARGRAMSIEQALTHALAERAP